MNFANRNSPFLKTPCIYSRILWFILDRGIGKIKRPSANAGSLPENHFLQVQRHVSGNSDPRICETSPSGGHHSHTDHHLSAHQCTSTNTLRWRQTLSPYYGKSWLHSCLSISADRWMKWVHSNRSANCMYFVLSGSRPNSPVGRWEKEARLRQCHILFYVREREAVRRSVNQIHLQIPKLELKWILILVNYIHSRKCIAKLYKHVKSHVAYRE